MTPHSLPLVSFLVFTAAITALAENSSRKIQVEFSKSRAIQGLTLDDKVELVLDRKARKGTSIVRGRFQRAGWRLLGKTRKTPEQVLVTDKGEFSLQVPLGVRLEIAFTLSALGPKNAEESETISLIPEKGADAAGARGIYYAEREKAERSTFNGSFFKFAPQFSFFSIAALDPVNNGSATFVSGVNPGAHFQLSPLATRLSPILNFSLQKVSLPSPASKTITNDSFWAGSAFAGALWWPTASRSVGLQFGVNAIRQPFVLASSNTTLFVRTVDLFRPELSFILSVADSYPYSLHLEGGGRLTLAKAATGLNVRNGFDTFVKLHTAYAMTSPRFLGVRQLLSTFGFDRRVFNGDIVNHTVQELTFQIGIGW